MIVQKVPKSSEKYVCKFCDFNTSRKSQYIRHLETDKHKMIVDGSEKVPKSIWMCECGKRYKFDSGYYRHKKICTYIEESDDEDENIKIKKDKDDVDYKAMFMMMIKDNKELRDTLITENKELRNQISELIPRVGNNNNSNNKQKFNINVFLNEQCKDALTMNEFIDKIKITLDNLMITKNKGLVEGVSNIFIENMNKLSLHERPIHCTDLKRETVYIKCDGEENDEHGGEPHWVKDKDNIKIKQAFRKVSHLQQRGLKQWIEKHPDWEDKPNKQEEYLLLINKCTADLSEGKREDKIIKKLCNEIYLGGNTITST